MGPSGARSGAQQRCFLPLEAQMSLHELKPVCQLLGAAEHRKLMAQL